MERTSRSPSGAPSRPRRRLLSLACALALLVGGVLLGGVGALVATAPAKLPLEAWHRLHVRGEITAARPASDLAEYRRRESALFRQVAEDLRRAAPRLPPLSRFDPASPTFPARLGRDWNRTFELPPRGEPAGAVLLLHGLTDSPYSLRALGERFAADGFHVVGLRLPGHGTVPAGLATVTLEDWRAAVRVGMAAAAGRRPAGRPLLVVGYSNGAALALDHALAALDDRRLPRPDALVLVSPALAVSPAARYTRLLAAASRLPRLEPLGWEPILPEYDPFKYSSFPTVAAYQLHRLTTGLEQRLARLERSGRLRELPPVLTLQSVVDDTIPAVASLKRLYARVLAADSELVLFDANRSAAVSAFLTPAAGEMLALAAPGRTFPFAVTLVTNESPRSDAVVARTFAPGARTATVRPLDLAWPRGVYSLSHVALPFPPDDPVYGTQGPRRGPLPFGTLEIRGERGVFVVPASEVARLRSNPFFPYLAERVLSFAERSRSSGRSATPSPPSSPSFPPTPARPSSYA
jgi:alpha-beta hydrolase superfamily lysophospholipase